MKICWRKSAIHALHINRYFQRQDFSLYVPGKAVFIQGYSIDLRMVLISVGTSDLYKVFYRLTRYSIEIFLVRHPRKND